MLLLTYLLIHVAGTLQLSLITRCTKERRSVEGPMQVFL